MGKPFDWSAVDLQICTPTARGVHPAMALQMIALVCALRTLGAKVSWAWTFAMPVLDARNEMATAFLASPCTHMLQWDDDIAVGPRSILAMIERDVDVCALSCRVKTADSRHMVFTGTVFGHGEPERGTVRAAAVGGGVLLVKRRVLEGIRDRHPELKYRKQYVSQVEPSEVIGFFDQVDDHRGIRMGEDVSFGVRARQDGFELHILLDAPTTHHGAGHWPGNFLDAWTDAREKAKSASLPQVAVPPGAPCPCGSGKPLAACHAAGEAHP